MESLQRDTDLSLAVLSHAIQPLTTDKGILTQDPDGGELPYTRLSKMHTCMPIETLGNA